MVELTKTDNLVRICRELEEAPFNWEEVVERFQDNLRFILLNGFDTCSKTFVVNDVEENLKEVKNGGFHITQYEKFFSEIWLDLALEDIARRHPEFEIKLDPLSEGAIPHPTDRTKNLDFIYDREGRLNVDLQNENGSNEIAEYDKVIYLKEDNLYVVFEVKIAKSLNHGTKGVNSQMKQWVIEEKLTPLKAYIDHEQNAFLRSQPFVTLGYKESRFSKPETPKIGYVVIAPPLITKSEATKIIHEKAVDGFKERNGILVPFYTNRLNYKIDVAHMVGMYGLRPRVNGQNYS